MQTEWVRRLPDEPGAKHVETHSHPVPRWVKVMSVLFALGLAACLGGGIVFLTGQRNRDAAQVERTRVQVLDELNRRSALRDEQQQAQAARTIGLVCDVLAGDLNPSERTQRLAKQLGCPEVPPP